MEHIWQQHCSLPLLSAWRVTQDNPHRWILNWQKEETRRYHLFLNFALPFLYKLLCKTMCPLSALSPSCFLSNSACAGGFWWFLFLIFVPWRVAGRSANSINVLKTMLASKRNAVRRDKGFGMKHQSVAQIHLSHACWVPQYLPSENEGMNKTCIQSLTHTHPSTQTLWHFSPTEIMQEKNNPNKYPNENYLVLHEFCYRKGIDLQAKCLCVQLELSFLRKVLKQWLSLLCLHSPKTWLAHWHAKHRHFPKRVTTHLPREKEQCQNNIIPFLLCWKLGHSGQLADL